MRILAVDDDPIILELLEVFTRSTGNHEITLADSGLTALQMIEQAKAGSFDCFMLDIQMPQMDGIELTSRIRKIAGYSNTPIIMLTAMSQKSYIDRAFAAGATDYATKPFEVTELTARLSMAAALVEARKSTQRWNHSNEALSAQVDRTEGKPPLHASLCINDVQNVIDCVAMENYVCQLSRGALLGSTVFAFTIRQIAAYHGALSSYDFRGMIEDSAEVISDCLADHQNLITYAGNGTFVCIVESGYIPNLETLMDNVNIAFSKSELYRTGGERLHPRVSTGSPIRLIWKTGDAVLNALAEAQSSAESAAREHEKSRFDYFEYSNIA